MTTFRRRIICVYIRTAIHMCTHADAVMQYRRTEREKEERRSERGREKIKITVA